MEFQKFPKIPRFFRTWYVTEKIDGTNATIFIHDDFETIQAGSRNRWITPEDDNYGFARWVQENKEDLLKLGPGMHRGEWWGSKIQRGYGKTNGERVFSLFNVSLWGDPEVRPTCCDCVPLLGVHEDVNTMIEKSLSLLRENGSVAAPGFDEPEGIILYHGQSGTMFKILLENDHLPKSLVGGHGNGDFSS